MEAKQKTKKKKKTIVVVNFSSHFLSCFNVVESVSCWFNLYNTFQLSLYKLPKDMNKWKKKKKRRADRINWRNGPHVNFEQFVVYSLVVCALCMCACMCGVVLVLAWNAFEMLKIKGVTRYRLVTPFIFNSSIPIRFYLIKILYRLDPGYFQYAQHFPVFKFAYN